VQLRGVFLRCREQAVNMADGWPRRRRECPTFGRSRRFAIRP